MDFLVATNDGEQGVARVYFFDSLEAAQKEYDLTVRLFERTVGTDTYYGVGLFSFETLAGLVATCDGDQISVTNAAKDVVEIALVERAPDEDDEM